MPWRYPQFGSNNTGHFFYRVCPPKFNFGSVYAFIIINMNTSLSTVTGLVLVVIGVAALITTIIIMILICIRISIRDKCKRLYMPVDTNTEGENLWKLQAEYSIHADHIVLALLLYFTATTYIYWCAVAFLFCVLSFIFSLVPHLFHLCQCTRNAPGTISHVR